MCDFDQNLIDLVSDSRNSRPLSLVLLVSWIGIRIWSLSSSYCACKCSVGDVVRSCMQHWTSVHMRNGGRENSLQELDFSWLTRIVTLSSTWLRSSMGEVKMCLDAVERLLNGKESFIHTSLQDQFLSASGALQMRLRQLHTSLISLQAAQQATRDEANTYQQAVCSRAKECWTGIKD